MKKLTLALYAIFIWTIAYGQSGITFKVEELTPPEELLSLTPYTKIWERRIRDASRMDDEPFGIVATSKTADELVDLGTNPFFRGMYKAYADHRPFVLSPDAVWLLISQGFSHHVNNNAERLRSKFVDFSGRMSLVVMTNTILLDDPDSPWEEVFPQFSAQIGRHTGNELVKLMTADFTTTTMIEKVASEITLMKSMESFFEYIIIYVGCGIPEITLTGTTEDWEKVLEKTRELARYDLEWWTSELDPILQQFVRASKGEIDIPFWQEMFKYHNGGGLYERDTIDGWIVKFFPYDKKGNRTDLQPFLDNKHLPEEMVKTDLKYIFQDTITGISHEIPLELWAGFIGVEQDDSDFTLTPKIAWMIRKKDPDVSTGMKEKLRKEADGFGINIRVKEIPEELLELVKINKLEIDFVGDILIPDRLAEVEISFMRLNGQIQKEEETRIRQLFPNTRVLINGDDGGKKNR